MTIKYHTALLSFTGKLDHKTYESALINRGVSIRIIDCHSRDAKREMDVLIEAHRISLRIGLAENTTGIFGIDTTVFDAVLANEPYLLHIMSDDGRHNHTHPGRLGDQGMRQKDYIGLGC